MYHLLMSLEYKSVQPK